MKKLFLLFALVMTSVTALPNETFWVTDEQGLQVCYEMLDAPGEVSFNGNDQWGWDISFCPESVIVPATVTYEGTEYKVTEIGKSALAHSGITHVMLSEGLKGIGYRAFSGSGIKEIVIPESVEWMTGGQWGAGVFAACEKLEKIQLPKNLKVLPESIFNKCTSLAEITIPEGVTTIEGLAFSECTALKSIVIPNTVTSIGEGAFGQCVGLETIQLSSNLVDLGSSVFQKCWSLNNVTIPAGVKSLPVYCFNECWSLSSVTLPDGLQEIGAQAFRSCQSLEELEIPSTVEVIGFSAFIVTSLKNVTLPKSLREIDSSAFSYSGLENLYINESNEYFACVDGVLYNKDVTEMIIYPDKHGDSYTIPATVTTLNISTIKALEHISVEPGSASFSCADGVLYDADGATLLLYTADAPRAFEVPSAVKKIGGQAFYGKPIESIVLNEGLETIGAEAFGSTQIANVNFPSTLIDIEPYAFYYSGLTEVNLPSSVERIGKYAFGGNQNLIFFTIGDGDSKQGAHTVIEEYAFYSHNNNLKTVILGPCVKEVCDRAFWSAQPTKIELSEGLERIGDTAFGSYDEYTYSSKDFTLPSTLKSLGDYAFRKIKFVKVTSYAITPPELKGDEPIFGLNLVVYDVAEQDYKNSRWASLFNSIKTMESSGIQNVDAECISPCDTNIYYDLSGRRVTNPTKGIYINNGRKVYIKQ